MSQHPKVVVLGAGSLFFGRQAIWQMVRSEHLNRGTLGLVDADPVHLCRMAGLARKAIKHAGVPLRLEADTDADAVLRARYPPLVGLCVLLFCLVGLPCSATVAATRAEAGRWGWGLFQFGGLTLLGYGLTVLVYQAGSRLF
jgi:Fe2+ transport system protein B